MTKNNVLEKSDNKVPKHIGIILDGNRRFSKRLMIKPWKGHEWGAKKVEKLLEWAKEIGIDELTLYAFSIENFDRQKKEFEYLMDLFRKELPRLLKDERIHESKIRVNFIGRIWMFPKDIQEMMHNVMDKTKNYSNSQINFAMAYGGRTEVVDAAKKIAEKVKNGKLDIEQINEEIFKDNLYLADEPDLIIRTGGEKRTSNFLSYQGAYSEWIFLDIMWPEFEKKDLINCINEYQSRKRRFGK